MSTVLYVAAKAPRPGRVKTRLAAAVGDEACAVEDDAVVAADEVYVDDGQFRHPRAVRDH